MAYRYTFRPSRFGRIAGARFRASQRVPYSSRYGAFGPASRSRARRVYARRSGAGRAGFVGVRGNFTRQLYGASSRAEVKNYDRLGDIGFTTTVGMGVPTSAITGAICTGLTQGTGENQRIGRAINVKSIHIRGMATFTPTLLTDTYETVVLYLILDTQANGGTVTGTPAGSTEIFSPSNPGMELLNMDNSDRFRVLRRWTHQFNTNTYETIAGASTTGPEQRALIDMYVKCNMKLVYAASTGNQAELRDNQVFLCAGSNLGKTEINASSRIRFTDA